MINGQERWQIRECCTHLVAHAHANTIPKRGTSVVNGATGAFKTVVVLGDETLIHIIATRARKAGEDAIE